MHQAKLQAGGRDCLGDGNGVWKAESLVIAKNVCFAAKNILRDDRAAGCSAEVREVIAGELVPLALLSKVFALQLLSI